MPLSLYLATGRLVLVVSYEGIEVASLGKMIKILEQTLLRKAIGPSLLEYLRVALPDPMSSLGPGFTEGTGQCK